MKTFTNYTQGPRGINLTDGTTHWIEPGQSAELDAKNVTSVPDLGNAPAMADSADDADLIASVESENADLKQQVADQGKTIADLTAKVDAATKPKA